MLDLESKNSRKRLWGAMKQSWTKYRPFLRKRRDLLDRYVGSGWGDAGDNKLPTMLPMIAETAQAYLQSLVATNPRVLISTREPELRIFAKTYTAAINNLLKEIHFSDSLRMATLDAFFSHGLLKLYWGEAEPVETQAPPGEEPGLDAGPEDWDEYLKSQHGTVWVDPGQPMVERISPDDFCFDMTASHWSRTRFQWHEYQRPMEEMRYDDRFDPKELDKIEARSRWDGGIFNISAGNRASDMNSSGGMNEDVEPMVRLADVYLPFENTWAIMTDKGDILHKAEWDGPERGPYRLLQFDDVPDNVLGLAPGMHLKPLHDLRNSLFRKTANAARRQKNNIVYQDSEDAERLRRAKDGEYIQSNNPGQMQPVDTGGPNQMLMAFDQMISGEFSKTAGNPEAMSGRAAVAKTASQEQLIHARMASSEEKMRERIVSLTQGVCEDLAQMLWVDESKSMQGEYSLPGIDDPFKADWTPEQREGDFIQYNLKVEPYSMSYQSPQGRIQQITQITQGLLLPMLPLLQQQGLGMDAIALTEIIADLADLPRLKEIWKTVQPQMPEGTGNGGGPGMGNAGPRHYVRENVSTGGTPDAQRTQNMQALMSGQQGES